jgi:hypothetical protein
MLAAPNKKSEITLRWTGHKHGQAVSGVERYSYLCGDRYFSGGLLQRVRNKRHFV